MKLLSNTKWIIVALLSLATTQTFYSCKKNTDTAKITKNTTTTTIDSATAYNISCTGGFNIGDTIWFHTSAPDTGHFQWNFGDGTTATDTAPYHVFTIADSFSVTLVINSNTANTARKHVQIKPDLSKFAGTWHWTGGYISFYGGDTSTPHSLSDTTFTISVIDDYHLSVWGTNLFYDGYSRVAIYPEIGFMSDLTSGANITYVVLRNDSLFFGQGSGGLGGGQHISYYTH